jgi:acyl-coenzyme A synthetase/AMP-(fatty) acid ligase
MSTQLPFWSSDLFESTEGFAIATKDVNLTYSDLNHMVTEYAAHLAEFDLKNQLAFLPMKMNIFSVVRYLACLRESIVPLLLPSDIDESLMQNLYEVYKPALSFGLDDLYEIELHSMPVLEVGLSKNLAVLLNTSGSTGSAKLVKLSHDNLYQNTKAICEYLKISSLDKAHCSLPLSYSYGLSVLNTHLQAGACVYLSELTPFSENYYDELIEENITSISGVPFFYQMLFRTGFFEKDMPTLKVMTQAGGKLGDNLVRKFSEYAKLHTINFFVMYGQTEATARISYVPPEMLDQKIGSIGIAIPGGKLRLSSDGELVYSGPNVMMGYARSKADLFLKESQIGSLSTGDLARVDADGYYYIYGRLKRFVKLAGSRYGLDEIEIFLEDEFEISCVAAGKDDKLIIFLEQSTLENNLIITKLQDKFLINRSFIKVLSGEQLARKPNGKKDYAFYRERYSEN